MFSNINFLFGPITLCAVYIQVEARFLFPFNRQLERRPASVNLPSLSASQRAVSYKNSNLNRSSTMHSSLASSSNSIHRSGSSRNAANSPVIMMESAAATHQGPASILNGKRANNQARRIPKFICRFFQ